MDHGKCGTHGKTFHPGLEPPAFGKSGKTEKRKTEIYQQPVGSADELTKVPVSAFQRFRISAFPDSLSVMPDDPLTSDPHDRFFKDTFGRAENAVPLLRGVLPPTLAEAIDWSSCSLLVEGCRDGRTQF